MQERLAGGAQSPGLWGGPSTTERAAQGWVSGSLAFIMEGEEIMCKHVATPIQVLESMIGISGQC